MAAGESQDCNWAARGWVRSLHFVFVSYASKAALRTDWKSGDLEDEAVGCVWDMVLLRGREDIGGWQREGLVLMIDRYMPADLITVSASFRRRVLRRFGPFRLAYCCCHQIMDCGVNLHR
jgi:hypothetical protein